MSDSFLLINTETQTIVDKTIKILFSEIKDSFIFKLFIVLATETINKPANIFKTLEIFK